MKLSRRLIIAAIILTAALGSLYFIFLESILPVDRESKTSKIIVVNKGEGLTAIARKLADEGLIRSRIAFYIVIKQLGIEKNLQAGDFRLSPSMNTYQIAKNLTHGSLDVWITVIEGLRKEEVARIIAENLNLPETKFIETAQEGYLFPDTYLIPSDATIDTVIRIMTSNFYKRLNEAKDSTPQKNNLTDTQILTLSSIVEREAGLAVDRPQVANVLLRRIDEGYKLQVDATIQYALGYQSAEKRWWKKELSFDDLKINSSYNTYLNYGLPPAPIANPGLASIKASLSADGNTPYLFYISDRSGKMHYAKNSEEHQANINKYLK